MPGDQTSVQNDVDRLPACHDTPDLGPNANTHSVSTARCRCLQLAALQIWAPILHPTPFGRRLWRSGLQS